MTADTTQTKQHNANKTDLNLLFVGPLKNNVRDLAVLIIALY